MIGKIVHSNNELPLNRHELFADAKDKEAAGEWEEAIALYEKVIKLHTLEEKAYDRLMIAYRKLKEPRNENEKNQGAENMNEEFNAEIQLARISCNLTRADVKQIISNSKQRGCPDNW